MNLIIKFFRQAFVLAAALALFFPAAALAANGQDMMVQQTNPAASGKTSVLKSALALQPQQQAEMQAVIRKANEQIKQKKENTHISKIPLPLTKLHAKNKAEKLQQDIATIRKEALGEMRTKLAPTQQTAFDSICEKKTKDAAAQAQFLKSLNLGRKQQIELAKLGEENKAQTWEVLGDNTLSEEAAVTKMQELKLSSLDNIKKQLNDEQRNSFEAWLKENSAKK